MALDRVTAYLQINRVDVQTRSISTGVTTDTLENVITGNLPQRVIIGMVEQTAFNGSTSKNPFNFQHFNLSELNVTIDGNNVPYQPFKFDFDSNTAPQYLRGYQTLIGLDDNAIVSNNITLEQFLKGFTVIALNLSQDGCINTDHLN